MKTIGHWHEKYPLLFQLPDNALIEIQRDAREGMVPVDDVAYCIHNSDKNLCASGPALLAENQRLREALRGVCEVVGHYAAEPYGKPFEPDTWKSMVAAMDKARFALSAVERGQK